MTGAVVLTSDAPLAHGGIKLLVEGQVTLQLSARSIGLFEAFSSALKPIPLLHTEIDVNAGSKVPKGSTPFPFEFTLRPVSGQQLFDTYHGVYINIQYTLTASLTRGIMQRPATKQKEILVETQPTTPAPGDAATAGAAAAYAAAAASAAAPPSAGPAVKGPLTFQVSPSSLQNIKESSKRKGQPPPLSLNLRIAQATAAPHLPRCLCPLRLRSSELVSHLPQRSVALPPLVRLHYQRTQS